jgi:hypothetical protein
VGQQAHPTAFVNQRHIWRNVFQFSLVIQKILPLDYDWQCTPVGVINVHASCFTVYRCNKHFYLVTPLMRIILKVYALM